MPDLASFFDVKTLGALVAIVISIAAAVDSRRKNRAEITARIEESAAHWIDKLEGRARNYQSDIDALQVKVTALEHNAAKMADRMAELEQENAALKRENSELREAIEQEREALEARVTELEAGIQILTEQLRELNQPPRWERKRGKEATAKQDSARSGLTSD